MYYVNEDIKKTIRVYPDQGRYQYYRYDMNENPDGLPEQFVADVLKEITPKFLATYPEPDVFLKKYAAYIGTSYDKVLATNGSDMAIRYILETFGKKGKNVVTVSPSFEMYWVNCSILGLNHVPVGYEPNLEIDVQKIIDSITNDAGIVVLLNPNNPIGNAYTAYEVEQIIEKAEQVGAIVVIDEAYHYFYKETFLKYALTKNNVIILRTFSKLFSIAACRLGVIISSPEIIHYIKNNKLTFDVNAIALKFGEMILDRPELINRLIAASDEGKMYALDNLKSKGYNVIDGKGNFFFVEPKRDADIVAAELKEKEKILVKSFSNELLKKYLRISTGSPVSMKVFLEGFFRVDEC